jgi:hypothetical protein
MDILCNVHDGLDEPAPVAEAAATLERTLSDLESSISAVSSICLLLYHIVLYII